MIGNIYPLQNNEILTDEKFSLGGKWLRGFDIYGAGPRNSATSYVGGKNLIITKFDYSKPINKNSDTPIYLNFFNDYGLVWGNKTTPTNSDNSIRGSYGEDDRTWLFSTSSQVFRPTERFQDVWTGTYPADSETAVLAISITPTFTEDTTVYAGTSKGVFRSGNGGSGASATANGSGAITGGDLTRFSGDIIYVENRSPVTRASDQIEDVKLIIEF